MKYPSRFTKEEKQKKAVTKLTLRTILCSCGILRYADLMYDIYNPMTYDLYVI